MQGRPLGSRTNRWLRVLEATDHPASGAEESTECDDPAEEAQPGTS